MYAIASWSLARPSKISPRECSGGRERFGTWVMDAGCRACSKHASLVRAFPDPQFPSGSDHGRQLSSTADELFPSGMEVFEEMEDAPAAGQIKE